MNEERKKEMGKAFEMEYFSLLFSVEWNGAV